MRPVDEGRLVIHAEASAWLARLKAENRSDADVKAFKAWLSADPRHEAAFDNVTSNWEIAATAAASLPRTDRRPSVLRRALVPGGFAAFALAAGLAVVPRDETVRATYMTNVGESRRVVLADGSSLLLDGRTRIEVVFDGARREVRLQHGRANFDVARMPSRPFVVMSGGQQVTALGTAFDIAANAAGTSVLLLRGSVEVRNPRSRLGAKAVILRPGQRLRFAANGDVIEDAPDLAAASAWQEGRIYLSDTRLEDAIAEFNALNPRQILLVGAGVKNLRISGIYGAADPAAFASSLSNVLPVDVSIAADKIVIVRRRETPASSG